MPLEIHTREADDDTIAILEDEHAKGAFPAVLHCFTGGRELAMRALALGLYVSFSGVLTFKKSDALRDIARDVPLDRLLVETDAPFLAPDPFRGKRNEPAYVAAPPPCSQASRASPKTRSRASRPTISSGFTPRPSALAPRQWQAEGLPPHDATDARSWDAAHRAACRALG